MTDIGYRLLDAALRTSGMNSSIGQYTIDNRAIEFYYFSPLLLKMLPSVTDHCQT